MCLLLSWRIVESSTHPPYHGTLLSNPFLLCHHGKQTLENATPASARFSAAERFYLSKGCPAAATASCFWRDALQRAFRLLLGRQGSHCSQESSRDRADDAPVHFAYSLHFTWIRYGLLIAILCTTAWTSKGRLGEHLHVWHVWWNGSLRGTLHVQARYDGADMGFGGSGKYQRWSRHTGADIVL